MIGDLLFPFEFHVAGTPVSLQGGSRSRERWKNDVRNAARDQVRRTVEFAFLDERPLALTIYYFPSAPMVGDVDNIVKPISDALRGVIYPDDRLIERLVVQKFEPLVAREFDEPTEELAATIEVAAGSDPPTPVVHVRVDDDLSWRTVR